jgi:hypothetical protein
MSVVFAIFVIGCLTILGFIALMIYAAFFMKEKEEQKWIAPDKKIRKYNMYRGKAL